jgi:hypothetical protein
MVIPNIWAMQHDEHFFPDPMNFKPERFLREKEGSFSEHDPLTEGHWAFGFGRRSVHGTALFVVAVLDVTVVQSVSWKVYGCEIGLDRNHADDLGI